MGSYYTFISIDFKSSDDEKKRFVKLLSLMDKEGLNKYDEMTEFPVEYDDAVENALLGKLEDRGEDGGRNCRYFPDFDLSLAPKLFASLFPDSEFSLEINWEYSVGGGQTVFFADYKDNKLVIRECQTEDDIELLDEETQDKYDEGDLFTEDIIDMLLEINGAKEVKPSRNEKYERSFCDGNDLLECIK